jgi:hypothetical protein
VVLVQVQVLVLSQPIQREREREEGGERGVSKGDPLIILQRRLDRRGDGWTAKKWILPGLRSPVGRGR